MQSRNSFIVGRCFRKILRIHSTSVTGKIVGVRSMYQLIGAEPSPYTAKIRSYLIYKGIPYERVAATPEIYSFIKQKVGWSVIPVLVTPEKKVIQDTTDMITYLENRHPEPSIIPKGPKQRIVAKLLELCSDEWLTQPIMHYRWSFPENTPYLSQEFGRMALPLQGHAEQAEIAEMISAKFKSMPPTIGISKKTGPEIERSYKELLADLTTHFDEYPYLLGDRPCIGDFAFGGMLYAHLFRDPVPGFMMKTTAPVVSAWCEMMNGSLPDFNRNNIHVLKDGWPVREKNDPEKLGFCDNDEIPTTTLSILKRMLTEFGPILLSTKKHLIKYIQENVSPGNTKLPRIIGKHEYTVGEVTELRSIIPFNIWMWQQVTDTYQMLPPSEKSIVDEWVSGLPHGRDIVGSDLSLCRVKRVKNFLHADPSSIPQAKL